MIYGSENVTSDEFEEADMFFNYFEKRPIWRFLYVSIIIFSTFFGLIANSTITYLKLRKFKERTIFEMLATSMSIGLIFQSITYFLLMLSLVTHDYMTTFGCYLEHFSGDFSNPLVIYSAIVLMIITKYNPDISRTKGFILIGIIWFVTLSASIPIYHMQVYGMKLPGSQIVHNVCLLFSTSGSLNVTMSRFSIKVYLEFVVPAIIVFAYFLVTLLFKTPKVMKQLEFWTYAAIIGSYFCITAIPVKVNMLFFYHYGTTYLNYGYVFLNSALMVLIIVIGPMTYFYCNRSFFREFCEYFGIIKEKESEVHEFFGDDRIVIMNN